jgi:hypothetical protein
VSETGNQTRRINSGQWTVAALAVGAFLYGLLLHRNMGHSAAMFLGIPTVLAVLLALTSKARTVTGGILTAITLALLIVAPLAGEGYLCILMASPLFYLVGIFVGFAVDWSRRNRNTTLSCVAVVLLPMCLEGIVPELTLSRSRTVEVTRVLNAASDQVEAALALSPKVSTPLPGFLKIGFPRPLQARGEGLSVGALRVIHFAGAEGDPPGDLVLQVTDRRPGYVRFETVSDSSKLTQWVRWEGSEVEWRAIDATHTAVTWRVGFERQLDPAWYFVPLERAAVHEAAKFLIEANATPPRSAR